MLVDSHAHLDFDAFQHDLDQVLARAWQAGLSNIIAVGSGRDTQGARDAIELASRQDRIFATVGVHPHDAHLDVTWEGDPTQTVKGPARDEWEQQRRTVMDRMKSMVTQPKVVAVGEVGLDYYYDHSPRELQRALFRSFIRLAETIRIPLVIHSREAEEDTVRILREENAQSVGGVIHCYGGSELLAQAALELGFCLGIAGPLTYKKADLLRSAVARLPLESLLVETDSPYLAPLPHRGRRNEPAYLVEVVRKLAELKSLSPEEVGRTTGQNARRLFGITS